MQAEIKGTTMRVLEIAERQSREQVRARSAGTRFRAPADPPPCCTCTRLPTGKTATPTPPALAA